ncbi:MAG: hypothetical protein K0R18_160 [Bacillales bacterium]|jgi:hypothetical protein|nr:hypothetical protein [Bacillales bacterium]
MSSYLPEKIYLYCKKPQDAVSVDIDEEDEDELDEDEVEEGVRHAFPVSDQSTQSRHENAEKWATKYNYDKNRNQTKVSGDVFEYPNVGFDSVTIKNLEVRGQGGRAYQVVLEHDDKKFQVDLREDALMDVIRNTGILAGGRLNGTFCFIVEGSQTNLVRENSKVWQSAKKGAESRKSATIKKSDLKIGHKYKSLSGDTGIYLGEVFARSISFKDEKETSYYSRKSGAGKLEYGKVAKKMIFVDAYTSKPIEDFKQGKTSYYNIKLQTSHSYREDLGKVGDINPAEIVSLANKIGENLYKDFTKDENSGYYVDNTLLACSLMEVSETKEIKMDQSKIDKAVENYRAYYKKHNRY